MSTMAIVLRSSLSILSSPVRLARSIRRILTPASTTLVLVCIITLNIIWGYPWTGMFAACASMLVFGFIANRIFRPRLKADVSIPASCQVDQTFSMIAHVENAGWLPTIDAYLQLHPKKSLSKQDQSSRKNSVFSKSGRESIVSMMPGERSKATFSVRSTHRGIHDVPDITCESLFPFHLFRSTHRISTNSTIAITPKPLDANEDDQTQDLMAELGSWSQKIQAGDSSEYTGSREYQPGMSVRRWDFASWARVGKPIVREFSTSSIQSVVIFVDTSDEIDLTDPELFNQPKQGILQRVVSSRMNLSNRVQNRSFEQDDPTLERMLSIAASALMQLSSRGIRVELVISGEKYKDTIDSENDDLARIKNSLSDIEPLLIRLASAHRVDRSCGAKTLELLLEDHRMGAILLISNHRVTEDFERSHQNIAPLFVSPIGI